MIQIRNGFKGERALSLPTQIIVMMESDPFFSLLHVTDIGYFPTARYHYRKREQGALQHILIWCVSGQGWVEYSGVRHAVLPNQYFVVPPHVEHTYGADADDPWTIYWVHFSGSLSHTYCPDHSLPSASLLCEKSLISSQIALFEEILGTLQMSTSPPNMHYACSCLFHFLGVMKHRNESSSVTQSQNLLVEQVVHFMHSNVGGTITAEQVANQFGYSYSHIAALFAKSVGTSLFNYFLQIKMQQACHYLARTDQKINEVCRLVGVDDGYYFSRMFKKHMGLSPREYRQQVKG